MTSLSRSLQTILRMNLDGTLLCENSFDPQTAKEETKKETVPKHGLGLKIIRNLVEKYEGVILEEATNSAFTVEIVIPLN